MSKIFTIKIAPVIKPFMRAKMTRHNAVCKYRDGSTYEYSPYRYGKPQCGRVYSYHDTDETVAERQPHIDRFVEVVEESMQRQEIVTLLFIPTITKMMKSSEWHLIRPLHLMRLRRYTLNVSTNMTLMSHFLTGSNPKCVFNTITCYVPCREETIR